MVENRLIQLEKHKLLVRKNVHKRQLIITNEFL